MSHAITNDLGQLAGIIAVDVRKFSKHNDVQQEAIVKLLPKVLEAAADRAGLGDILRGSVFRAFRGDGYLIGFDPNRVVDVVDRYFDSLQAELRRRSQALRAEGIELRLRSSLHLGPLRSFDESVADSPSGRLMVESGRMVDAPSVRALLEHSDPTVTYVATVVSDDVMRNVIGAGRTARQPSEFVEAPLQIEAKDYSGKGYLRVPVPSGDLLRYGLLHGQPDETTKPEAEQEPETTPLLPTGFSTANFNGNAKNQVGTMIGDIKDDSVHDQSSVVTHVVGNGNSVAGNDINTTNTFADQVYSGSFYTRGDSNFGASSGRRVNESAAEGR